MFSTFNTVSTGPTTPCARRANKHSIFTRPIGDDYSTLFERRAVVRFAAKPPHRPLNVEGLMAAIEAGDAAARVST